MPRKIEFFPLALERLRLYAGSYRCLSVHDIDHATAIAITRVTSNMTDRRSDRKDSDCRKKTWLRFLTHRIPETNMFAATTSFQDSVLQRDFSFSFLIMGRLKRALAVIMPFCITEENKQSMRNGS